MKAYRPSKATPRFAIYMLALFSLAFSWVGCKTQKTDGQSNIKKKSGSFLLEKLEDNQIDFQWFNAKANIRYSAPQGSQSFSSTIRLRKDSLIWLTVKKLGIEGGRALITPDSIFILNRLLREYYPRDFGYLKREFDIPFDFRTLQQLLVGNAIHQENDKIKAGVEKPYHRLTSSSENQRVTFLLEPSAYLVHKMLLEDYAQERTMDMTFSSHRKQGRCQLPMERNITLQSPETGELKVDMVYSKVELDVPQNTPFTVSPRYQVK